MVAASWTTEGAVVPIDPCGQVVQYLNRCYRCQARFYVDGVLTEYTKVWYWADAGAAQLPFYHVHGSQHFMDRQIPPEEWGYPGELPGFTTYNGNANPGLLGKAGCYLGEQSWWVEGVPAGITRDDIEIPECCLPLEPSNPTVDGVIAVFGSPDLLFGFGLTPERKHGVLCLGFFGDFTTPPTVPSGWNTVRNSVIPGTTYWLMVAWQPLPALPFIVVSVDGGSSSLASGIMFASRDSVFGVSAFDSTDYDDSTIITAPSLSTVTANQLLVAVYLTSGLLPVVSPPPGMTLLGSSAAFPEVRAWSESIPDVGPTGTRTLTILSAPLDAAALSLLIR